MFLSYVNTIADRVFSTQRDKHPNYRLWLQEKYELYYQHLAIEHCRIRQCWDSSVGIMLPYLYRGKLTFWWPCECLKHIDLGKINLLVHFPSFTNNYITSPSDHQQNFHYPLSLQILHDLTNCL